MADELRWSFAVVVGIGECWIESAVDADSPPASGWIVVKRLIVMGMARDDQGQPVRVGVPFGVLKGGGIEPELRIAISAVVVLASATAETAKQLETIWNPSAAPRIAVPADGQGQKAVAEIVRFNRSMRGGQGGGVPPRS